MFDGPTVEQLRLAEEIAKSATTNFRAIEDLKDKIARALALEYRRGRDDNW